MNKLKITIIIIMVALTSLLFLLPAQPDVTWLKWISIALWIVLIIIIARNSDLFERPKIQDKYSERFTIDPKLKKFLIKKGAYDAFCEEIIFKMVLLDTKQIPYLIDSVNGLITWERTSQGYKYWRDLHLEYIEEKKK